MIMFASLFCLILFLVTSNLIIYLKDKRIFSMPYLFKTEVRQSAIEGLGLFALENIPKGAAYWSFYASDGSTPNRAYTRQEMQSLGEEELKTVLHGGFYFAKADLFIECKDGGQFVNHSQNPNTQYYEPPSGKLEDMHFYTIKDIKAGEQICNFYPEFYSVTIEWLAALLKKYDPQLYEFEVDLTKTYKPKENQTTTK